MGGTPDQMMQVIRRDVAHWRDIVRTGNVTVD